MKSTSTKVEKRKLTANEDTDVKDIKNNFLYTKSGYVIAYLRLFSINIDLLSNMEKNALIDTLTASFKPEKNPFIIMALPRTLDMESYLTFITNKYDTELENVKRKMLLNEMIHTGTETVMSGKNFEHQFYLKVWNKVDGNNEREVEFSLNERMRDMESRYESISNSVQRLDNGEIIRLCNLFGNSTTAVFEHYEEDGYIPLSFIKREGT